MLATFDLRKCKEECLPIVIMYDHKEKLIAVPKLDNSSGSKQEQFQAVWNAIIDWNLDYKGQIFCRDVAASNKSACVPL